MHNACAYLTCIHNVQTLHTCVMHVHALHVYILVQTIHYTYHTCTLHVHAGTSFRRLIGDPNCPAGPQVEKVVLCSGKIYYELLQERNGRGLQDKVALLRVEQVSGWEGLSPTAPLYPSL